MDQNAEGGFSLDDAHALVSSAHAGQVDAAGQDYYLAHLLPVAARLTHFGEDAVMAGLLHDIIEDTAEHPQPYTAQRLRDLGVPAVVVDAVVACTRVPGEPYKSLIVRACAHPLGRQVKLADNTHNLASNAALALLNPDKARSLREKRYLPARAALLDAGALDAP